MDTLQPSIETMINSTFTSLLSEEKEKEKRKLNLILHRIPKSTSEYVAERRVHDNNHVKSILQDYLIINAQVDTVARIGKKDPEKTRLLKVDVLSEKLKKQVLRNSSKLRDDSNPDWVKTIFITPDPPKEQTKNKVLREKLNKTVPRSYCIKNGQIVRRERYLLLLN